jgi:MYXO-CTERM domain-containing protein
MLPGARAAQISQGFNSILTLPGAGGGAVDNSTPPASNQVFQNSVTVVDQDAAYYAAKAAAAFGAPVVAPTNIPTLTPNPNSTSGDVGNALLDANPNLKPNLPASFTLETATIPGQTGLVTGTVTLPSFIVPDPPPVAAASFNSGFVPWDSFDVFDVDAPEPGGTVLAVLGLVSLAAVGVWRRRLPRVRSPY